MQFPKRKTKLTAQIDNEDIRREFNADIGDRQDLWIRGHLRDPDELVVENWDGTTLYKVAYTITGTDVEFGDLREQQLTDVPEVLAARSGRLVASYNRPESRPANTTQEGQMDRDAIVSLLELPAETTDEQAQEALTKARGAVTSTDPVVDTEAEETNTVDEADPIAATLKLPEGYTAVKIDRLGKLEASIADLDKTRKAQLLAARDSEAKTWLNEGRISKDELDDAVALNRTDQKLAASIFGSRAKGTVPVDGERGTSADNEGRSDRLAAAMAIHRGGKTVTNTKGA